LCNKKLFPSEADISKPSVKYCDWRPTVTLVVSEVYMLHVCVIRSLFIALVINVRWYYNCSR